MMFFVCELSCIVLKFDSVISIKSVRCHVSIFNGIMLVFVRCQAATQEKGGMEEAMPEEESQLSCVWNQDSLENIAENKRLYKHLRKKVNKSRGK